MSPIRARKALRLGPWLRVNFTLRSVVDFLRDVLPDGHIDEGARPWSSVSVGPRGASYNTRRRTARVDLPGPFSYETGPFGTRHRIDPDREIERPELVVGERLDGLDLGAPRWSGTWDRDVADPDAADARLVDGSVYVSGNPNKAARTVPCPKPECRAPAGAYCRYPSGRRSYSTHRDRIEDWIDSRLAANAAETPADPGGPTPPWGTPPPHPGDDRP
jgi:hypothetical protein